MKKLDRLGYADFPIKESIAILESDAPIAFKREAVSSLGRKRNPKLIKVLFKYGEDKNPEIAIQAIRGLLVFKKDPLTLERLVRFCDHPNEMIRDVVRSEINGVDDPEELDHASSPDFMKNVVVHGDVLKILQDVPDHAVHLTFTSPPYYNARDYSTYQSYKEYLAFLERVFKEVHRVTKTGRFFILNTSPVIIPRAGRKYSSRRYPVPFDIHPLLVKMGWEFIDDIVWAKPVESSKNRVAGFEMNRKPLTYKPNARTEYVMVYRRRSHKLIDWNLRQYSDEVVEGSKVGDGFERSNVWNISPAIDKIHSAVFPIKLCEEIIKLYSFERDLVFDPFAGSGTFGRAAMSLDRHFFMTELSDKYVYRIQENIGTGYLLPESQVRFLSAEEFRNEN